MSVRCSFKTKSYTKKKHADSMLDSCPKHAIQETDIFFMLHNMNTKALICQQYSHYLKMNGNGWDFDAYEKFMEITKQTLFVHRTKKLYAQCTCMLSVTKCSRNSLTVQKCIKYTFDMEYWSSWTFAGNVVLYYIKCTQTNTMYNVENVTLSWKNWLL